MILFSGSASTALAEKIAHHIGKPLGICEHKIFSDGEMWVKYRENIRGKDVYLIQSTNPPADNLMELLIMIDAAKRSSALRVSAVIPYFGYARQDRKDQPRVAITAKLVANLLTSAGADRIIAMDLHAPQIQGFFDIPVDHLYGSAVFIKHFQNKKIPNLVVVSPDVGGIKMAASYAKRLRAELVVLDKRRPVQNEAEILNIIGDVKGKNILIVDDLIDTGGTFLKACVALKNAGARSIIGASTHPVCSGKAAERIAESHVDAITVTDSIPVPEPMQKLGIVEVRSVAELFAEAIKRTHSHQSISSLFDVDKDKTI